MHGAPGTLPKSKEDTVLNDNYTVTPVDMLVENASHWIWVKSCKRYIHRKTKTGRAVLLEAEAALSIAQVKKCFINHKCDYECWRHVGKQNLQQNEPANPPFYRRFWRGKDLLGWPRTIPKSGIPNEIQPGNAGADVIPQASCSTTPSLIDMSRLDDHIVTFSHTYRSNPPEPFWCDGWSEVSQRMGFCTDACHGTPVFSRFLPAGFQHCWGRLFA